MTIGYFPDPYGSVVASRGFSIPTAHGTTLVVGRIATDAMFYATLTLNNIVAGSRYRITRTSTGDELATGLVAGSGLVDEVIAGIPCFSSPMQVNITVRNASGATKYKVFNTAALMVKAGASAYILQIED